MADKKSNDADTGEKKKSPVKKILPIVLCLALAGGGYFMGGGGGSAEPATTEPEEVKPYEEIHEIVSLDPVNVNLADGHYLRVAVALGLGADEHDDGAVAKDDGHGGGTDEDAPSIETAPASDLVLRTFSGLDIAELQSPAGRESAREQLHEQLNKFYGDKIHTVLFTEFVMQ
jgi:flagellar FliL protein